MRPVVHGQSEEALVRFRQVDVVLMAACSVAALVCVGPARWAPHATRSACLFGLMALGVPLLRILEARFPRQPLIAIAADFWLLPVSALSHGWLGPIVDWMNPLVKDAQLIAVDERLFGFQAAVSLSHVVPPWANDVLMLCYYGHFAWPLLLGIFLYARGRGPTPGFDEYLLGLGLLLSFNYAAYSLVPAVGPRYFLIGDLRRAPAGWLLTPLLDSMMRTPVYTRDCFPSGHTGAALVVLIYAFRYARRFFWVMLFPRRGPHLRDAGGALPLHHRPGVRGAAGDGGDGAGPGAVPGRPAARGGAGRAFRARGRYRRP